MSFLSFVSPCACIRAFAVLAPLGIKPTAVRRVAAWGGFIVLCIASLGTLALVLHHEMMRGVRAALWLAGFNGLFWLARVLVDTFFFRHEDWPKGRQFVLGHVLLTSLFCALVLTYAGVIGYHVFLSLGRATL